MSFAPAKFDFSKEGDIMSTTRKILTTASLFISLCVVSQFTVSPAMAADNGTSDDPDVVVLGPAPTANPVAAPTVKKAHRHGYIKACEPSRSHGGRKINLAYGSFKQPEPDGYKTIRAGHCKVFRVYHVYGPRHRLDWVAFRASNGAIVATGHVRHIHL